MTPFFPVCFLGEAGKGFKRKKRERDGRKIKENVVGARDRKERIIYI